MAWWVVGGWGCEGRCWLGLGFEGVVRVWWSSMERSWIWLGFNDFGDSFEVSIERTESSAAGDDVRARAKVSLE